MFTQLLTTAAALLLLGGGCHSLDLGNHSLDLGSLKVELFKGTSNSYPSGTVVLTNGTQRIGLVGGKGVDGKTAEMLCNKAGYDFNMVYNVTKNITRAEKLTCDQIKEWDTPVITENITCPSNSTDLANCSASLTRDWNVDDALWLSCSNDWKQFWEIKNITLAYNEAGNIEYGDMRTGERYGTVLVTLRNVRTGEERTGLTPHPGSRTTTADNVCTMTGHPPKYNAIRNQFDGVSDISNTKLSCGFMIGNEMKYVVSYLSCYGSSLQQCQFKVVDDFDSSEKSTGDSLHLTCNW